MKEYYTDELHLSNKAGRRGSYSGLTVEANDNEDYVVLFDTVNNLIQIALQEYEKEIQDCRSPAVIIEKYNKMSEDERNNFHVKVVESIVKEEKSKSNSTSKTADYTLSFSGSAADTSAEKEAASIMRGDEDKSIKSTIERDPYLIPPSFLNEDERHILRKYGRWCRYLGGAGCYMYIHILTKEVVSIRPEEYEDELVNVTGEETGPNTVLTDKSNGLNTITITTLPSEIDRIISETKKTPFLLDGTKEGAVRTYYSYKAVLEDISMLLVPFAKSGIKRSDVEERCRMSLVKAMKTGVIFALYLGSASIEHIDCKKKFCKKDVFPLDTFTNAGARLLEPKGNPRYHSIYREEDLEHGQAIVRDGFRVVVISTLEPKDYLEKLQDCIPLGYMHPVYVID
eukprot:CAMPEP_0182434526 /NCGR_PEP_ID=MMETSP1167-20130531/70259_1 /TAXON_ID=2988 /ORGANISM="Mallomonas Sp, Strain CCMP3275" /LENGTH=397 /DNA_ID=CAMNT_0024624501 /DNA_START=220 /DNA_END=1413 /DNA_ORIENTATION=+